MPGFHRTNKRRAEDPFAEQPRAIMKSNAQSLPSPDRRAREFATKVNVALTRLLPTKKETRVGVAVSGGPDSVALLSVLANASGPRSFTLIALHVNHGLRAEANQEQDFVETLCRRWDILCLVSTLMPPPVRRGIEAWARAERYRCFDNARRQHNLDVVTLAHTLDDQAETVLFRLLRGSGRRGLAGIPAARDGWITRPLLGCSRAEILAYLAAENLSFTTDASNTDLRYSRNKIRHVLLPFLEREFSPQVRRRLTTLAAALREEEEWLEVLAAAARSRTQESSHILSLSRLLVEPRALHSRILRQWLEANGSTRDIGFTHVAGLRALSEGHTTGSVTLPGSCMVVREGDSLLLRQKDNGPISTRSYCYTLVPGQELFVPEARCQITMTESLPWNKPLNQAHSADRWQALFDAASLPHGLIVRNVRRGDRVHPLGMTGRKKVHDIFIDQKIPATHRRHWPLLVNTTEIVWVPGCIRSTWGKVTAATRHIYRVVVHPLPEK